MNTCEKFCGEESTKFNKNEENKMNAWRFRILETHCKLAK